MDQTKKEIGQRIKELRKEKKLTQEKIAEMLDISQKHYSETERGLTGLSVSHYIRLSELFSVSLDYLLRGIVSENSPESAKRNKQLNEIYYSVSEDTQKQLLRMAEIAKTIEQHAKNSLYKDKIT